MESKNRNTITSQGINIPGHPLEGSLRSERLPSTFCGGCGIGITIQAYLRAINKIGISKDKYVTISGIGCTGRSSGYIQTDGFHTTHGRAIPFAMGVKTTRPDMNVVVLSGDGDLFSIGAGHFLAAARRNIDMTVITINNSIYGMTGGQTAPTTFYGAITSTTPVGATLDPFNLAFLAKSAGAQYIARATVTNPVQLEKLIFEGIQTKGFSFIEVISPCVVVFGNKNKLSTFQLYHTLKNASVKLTEEEKQTSSLAKIEFESLVGYTRVPVGKFIPLERALGEKIEKKEEE